jgi:FimV-like protein
MARSFSRPRPENRVENYTARNSYYHPASDTHFEMIERDGKYFQRQFQIGFQGRQTNELETQIDFVMGSGNHARTYLHRTSSDELLELPLGWYAEQGGTWSMNPGYDRPDHAGLSRTVPYGCMFCHNAYPQIPAARGPRANPVFLSVPEGIDCQRCHGDGQEHVRLARAGSRVEEIRRAVVNPSRLSFGRQLEVCLQCHLEPRSSSTSSLIVRYEREPFSYKPGEALDDFRLHFDQTSRTKREDRFEVVGAGAYRLMQSQCFLRSNGAMTCGTCHDPHREVAARDFVRHYSTICNNCHAAKMTPLIGSQRHTADPDCVACHMPKRRTQDAVHVVMTDHLIQRRKPDRDLLAPLSEVAHPESDEVTPSYPSGILRAVDNLYLGVAQVNESGTRSEGITRLAAAIAEFHPAAAEYYLQLGDALRASRRFDEAIAPYDEAIRREPQSAIAHDRLAFGLTRIHQFGPADAQFQEALRLEPGNPKLWNDVGISYLEQGRMREAAEAFEKSLAIDVNQHEAHNGLGGARMKTGDLAGAEAEFRQAIRFRPHYAEAHHNLAYLLSVSGRFEEAKYHFEEALHINPNHPETHFDYAVMLARANRAQEAQRELEAVLRGDPRHVKALDLLGNLFEAQGRHAEAIQQFRRAVVIDPGFPRANLDLGAALIRSGDKAGALPFLEKAASTGDAAIGAEARRLLDSSR